VAFRPEERFWLPSRRKLSALAVASLAIALLLSCDGCPASPSTAARDTLAHDAGVAGSDDSEFITEDEYEILPIGQRLYLSDGYRDIGNRYPFAVMVGAAVGEHETIMCSGTLLNPRLVLTAGHCVCGANALTQPGNQTRTIIDGSRCAQTATVETVTYSLAPNRPALLREEQFRSYDGKVRPHPSLEILLDERGVPISSKADLAVIALDKPIEGTLSTVLLPTTEVRLNESFTIAGYGFDGRSDLILGLRRFGRKKIIRLATPSIEGILFEQDGAAFTSGSGEPCLRQNKSGVELMGVTTLISEEGTAFTSAYPYREWLLSEIRRSTSQQSNPPGDQDSGP
jgi:hypothetical protein